MKKIWTIILVVFMLCIGFGTAAYATDANLGTPDYDTPGLDMVDFPTMQDTFVSGYTDLPDKIGFSMGEDNLYSYAVMPGAYRSDGIWLRCCNSNSYLMINGKPYNDGARHIAHIKSKMINLRT